MSKSTKYSLLLLSIIPTVVFAKATEFNDFMMKAPYPKVTVSADGNKYNKVLVQGNVTFRGMAKGSCTSAYNMTHAHANLNKNGTLSQQNIDRKELYSNWNNKGNVWSKSWKTITTQAPINADIRQQVIAACNTELNKRIQLGKSKSQILSEGFSTTVSPYYMGFTMNCSALKNSFQYPSESFRKAPISVDCQSYKSASPKPALLTSNQISKKLNIKNLTINASPKNYTGQCPKPIKFTANLATNGSIGKVRYRFLENGSPVTNFKEISLTSGNSFKIFHTVTARAKSKTKATTGFGVQAQKKGMQAQLPLQKQSMQTVSIEVQNGPQKSTASTDYFVNCTDKPSIVTTPKLPAAKSKPDLTSRNGINIGQKFSPWGGTINLAISDASNNDIRGCQFRMAYDVINIGKADSGKFDSRLYSSNIQVHTQKNMQINKGVIKKANGVITLKPGRHILTAKIDTPDTQDESKENNNTFRVTANVASNCGSNQ